MQYKKILTIQDISCVGQCSLTVAMPIISACGHETCILPSAVLSTHTGGFSGFTVHDLSDEMPKIINHWKKEGILFDAVYTGYLGSTEQIAYVEDIFRTLLVPGGLKIVDPAMADNGKLYPAFDMAYVKEMRRLCDDADILLPNMTEASFLTGREYRSDFDRSDAAAVIQDLCGSSNKCVILTGTGYEEGKSGVTVYDGTSASYYSHVKFPRSFHGTGDVYSSAFTGALLSGCGLYDAARIAADFTVESIAATQGDAAHWYGVKFETALPSLIHALQTAEMNRV